MSTICHVVCIYNLPLSYKNSSLGCSGNMNDNNPPFIMDAGAYRHSRPGSASTVPESPGSLSTNSPQPIYMDLPNMTTFVNNQQDFHQEVCACVSSLC